MKLTLQEYLKVTGQSYEVFAQKVGLTRQMISRIVKEKDMPSIRTAIIIWEATDCEVGLASIYPLIGKLWPSIKKIEKADLCENLSHGCNERS